MTFDPGFARLPSPPYVAVIFSSRRSAHDDALYQATAARMLELARQQPGFLGEESTRGADGFGITVAYWASESDALRWKGHAEHRIAQETGRARWYEHYEIRVATVTRAYGMNPQEKST